MFVNKGNLFNSNITKNIYHLKKIRNILAQCQCIILTTTSVLLRKLLVINPEKCQLIHPPINIIGNTLVKFPFAISTIIVGSTNNIQSYNSSIKIQRVDLHKDNVFNMMFSCKTIWKIYDETGYSTGRTWHWILCHSLSLLGFKKSFFFIIKEMSSHLESLLKNF